MKESKEAIKKYDLESVDEIFKYTELCDLFLHEQGEVDIPEFKELGIMHTSQLGGVWLDKWASWSYQLTYYGKDKLYIDRDLVTKEDMKKFESLDGFYLLVWPDRIWDDSDEEK